VPVGFDRIGFREPARVAFEKLFALAFVERIKKRLQRSASKPVDQRADVV
jgi:hypothetical protein